MEKASTTANKTGDIISDRSASIKEESERGIYNEDLKGRHLKPEAITDPNRIGWDGDGGLQNPLTGLRDGRWDL